MKKKQSKKVIIHREFGGVIGRLNAQREFTRVLPKSMPYYQSDGGGWGTDITTLGEIYAKKGKHVVIEDAETGDIYRTSLQIYLEKGVEKDFGYGRQLFLNLKYWKVTKN